MGLLISQRGDKSKILNVLSRRSLCLFIYFFNQSL